MGLAVLLALGFGIAVLFVTFFFTPARLVFEKGFSPTSGTLVLLFGAAIVAALGIGGVALGVDLLDQEYKNRKPPEAAEPEAPAPLSLQEQRVAEYKGRGYESLGEVTFKYDAAVGGPSPDELPLQAELMAKPAVQTKEGVWTRSGAITYADGAWADFKITVLFDDETWQRGDAEHFEQKRAGRPVHIESALETDYIRETTAGTHYVYCFGLASADTRDQERNERLSFDRAANLCKALHNLEYVKPKQAIGVGLGYATVEVQTKQQLSRQRAAIFVGVRVMEEVRLTDLATSIASMIVVDGVNVSNYSRGMLDPFVVRDLGSGAYTGIDGMRDAEDEESFWKIAPTAEEN